MSQVEGGGVWACGVRPIGLEPCSSDTEVHNNLLELARTMNAEQAITEDDPVLVFDFSEANLNARQPGGGGKAIIAGIVMGAGMQEVPDATGAPSRMVFRGSMGASQAAINALCYTPWVRRVGGQPDVGRTWLITDTTTVVGSAAPFNA